MKTVEIRVPELGGREGTLAWVAKKVKKTEISRSQRWGGYNI